MKIIISFLIIISTSSLFAQRVLNKEKLEKGEIALTEEISIPKVNSGYTVWLPDTGEIKGLVVFTHARRDTINGDSIIEYALSNQLAIMYATTDNRFEFFFDNEKMLSYHSQNH